MEISPSPATRGAGWLGAGWSGGYVRIQAETQHRREPGRGVPIQTWLPAKDVLTLGHRDAVQLVVG